MLLFCQREEDVMTWPRDRLFNVNEININEMMEFFLVEKSWNQWFLSKSIFCISRFRKNKRFPEN